MAYAVALVKQGVMDGPRVPKMDDDHEWIPIADMKWAVVKVTLDTTSYSTGGTALNVLGALTGWTSIGNTSSQSFLQGTTVSYAVLAQPNHSTAGSRLLKLLSRAADTEHAASATTAKVFLMYVVGW